MQKSHLVAAGSCRNQPFDSGQVIAFDSTMIIMY